MWHQAMLCAHIAPRRVRAAGVPSWPPPCAASRLLTTTASASARAWLQVLLEGRNLETAMLSRLGFSDEVATLSTNGHAAASDQVASAAAMLQNAQISARESDHGGGHAAGALAAHCAVLV